MELEQEMREWADETYKRAHRETPKLPVLVAALSSDINKALGYSFQEIVEAQPGACAWGFSFPFSEHEEALGAMAQRVWEQNPRGRVFLSWWPKEGDYSTLPELNAPGQHPGDAEDAQSHWLLNLMCLMGVLVPLDTDSERGKRRSAAG